MVFKIDVNNIHLPRIKRSLGYEGNITEDPAAFRIFVEQYLASKLKEQVILGLKSEAEDSVVVPPDSDIAPAP